MQKRSTISSRWRRLLDLVYAKSVNRKEKGNEKDISNATQELKNLNDELKEAQANVGKLNNKPVEVKVKGEEKVSELREQFQNLAENSADAVEAFANFSGIEIEEDKMQAIRDLGGAVAGMLDPAKWSSPLAMLTEGFTALSAVAQLFENETAQKMESIRQEMKETAEAFEEAKEKLGEELLADTSRLGSARKLVEDIVTRLGAGETGDGIDGMVGHLLEIVPEAEDGVRKIGDAWQVNVDVLDDVLDKLERQAEMSYYAGQVDEAYAAKRKQDKALEEQLELVEPGEVEFLTPEQVEQKIQEIQNDPHATSTVNQQKLEFLQRIQDTGGYYGDVSQSDHLSKLNEAYMATVDTDAAYEKARQEMSNYVDGENERSANEYKTPEWIDELNDALRPFQKRAEEVQIAERHLQEGRYDLAANKLGVEFDEKDDDVAKAEKLREEINEQKEEAGKEIAMAQIDAIEGIKMNEELTAGERVELERYS